MNHKIFVFSSLILTLSLACSITLRPTPAAPPNAPQIIVVPAGTSTPTALPTVTSQNPPVPVEVVSTLTASPTSTASPSPTPAFRGPVAKLIKDANCRRGPGTAFVVVTSFLSGQVLEIVGRNPDFNNTWWLVIIPGTNSTCWISFVTAQATGDFDSIPVIPPPY